MERLRGRSIASPVRAMSGVGAPGEAGEAEARGSTCGASDESGERAARSAASGAMPES